MISWLQVHLMKNARWIFSTLLVIILFAFVFTINQAGGLGRADRGAGVGEFHGVDLNDARTMRRLAREASLSQWITTGREPSSNPTLFDMERRIALSHFADLLSIPSPTEAELREFVTTRALFRGPDGAFSRTSYDRFLDGLEQNPAFTEEDAAHVLAQDFRVQRALELLSGPGFQQDFEIRRNLERLRSTRTAVVATFDAAGFQPAIEPSDEAIAAHYASKPDAWADPARVRSRLVRFRGADFAASLPPPSEGDIAAFFARNTWRFRAPQPPPAADGTPAPTPPEPVLEDHRDDVVTLLLDERGREAALAAADNFATELYQARIYELGPAFDSLLAASRGTLVDLAPYARGESPAGSPVPLTREALDQQFDLATNRPFGDAFRLFDGGGVLVRLELIPSRVRPLEEVRELVVADYVKAERDRLFNEAGRAHREALAAAVAAGTPFAEAAAAAGLTTLRHEGFTMSDPPEALEPAVGVAVGTLQAGELTAFLVPADGANGKIGFLESITPPEESAIASDVELYRTQFGFFASNTLARGLLEEAIVAEERRAGMRE